MLFSKTIDCAYYHVNLWLKVVRQIVVYLFGYEQYDI